MHLPDATIETPALELRDWKSLKEEPGTPFGARFAVKLEDAEWKLVCALSNNSDCSDDAGGEDEEQIEIEPDP